MFYDEMLEAETFSINHEGSGFLLNQVKFTEKTHKAPYPYDILLWKEQVMNRERRGYVCVGCSSPAGRGRGRGFSRSHFISPLPPPVPFLPHLQWTKSTAVNDLAPGVPWLWRPSQSWAAREPEPGRKRKAWLAKVKAGRDPVLPGGAIDIGIRTNDAGDRL